MKENQNPVAIYLKDYQVPDFLIDKTELAFFLYPDYTLVKSRLRVKKNPQSPNKMADLILSGVELELLALTLNGVSLQQQNYRVDKENLTIFNVGDDFSLQDGFSLEIETRIQPHLNTALEGLYVSKGMYCTQCEAHGFRRITYYLDRPDVMSAFEVYVEADKTLYPILLSNGNCIDKGELAVQQGSQRHWVKWQDPFKKPCYLFALVAGNLECVKDEFIRASGKPVSLELFVEKQDVDKCAHALQSLKNAMRWDEQVFGREYDLDVYMIVAVNHFNMGAMENKGLNIFNTSCVLAHELTTSDLGFERVEGVVAHEYFHNWSGNRVTCRDWFQLSLKEGFTVFRDEEFSSDMGSRTVKRIDDVNILRNFQFKEDAGPMAHPVRPPSYIEMNNFYTVTVYNKGAEVVRMLHTLLGAKKFREACDVYFERFDGQAVTCDDFVACMEEISSRDFTQFKRWYSQAGTPVLTLQVAYEVHAKKLTLNFSQTCPATPEQAHKESFLVPIKVALFSKSGKKLDFSYAGQSCNECLLELVSNQQSFELEGVESAPVLSLLRNFSAPVKLEVDYSSEDLALLMAFDDDGFNAWDASQRLYMKQLKQAVADVQAGKTLVFDESLKQAIQTLLNKKDIDKALLARMLGLPSQSFLAEQYELIDVDAVYAAHRFLEQSIAQYFADVFKTLYLANLTSEAYQPNSEQIGQRSLKNMCLRYLCLLGDERALELAKSQFSHASNMTDQGAAFRALAGCDSACFSEAKAEAIEHFYKQWQHEALVIDQWFSVQASVDNNSVLASVKALMQHRDFDMGNPNRVRSVLASFAQNYAHFHAADGSGYEFFAQQIRQLNTINPQIAARLVTSLVHWKRYSGKRSELMKAQLEALLALPDLSKDVYEIVSRALV